MAVTSFRQRPFLLAWVIGGVLQVLILAFGLHASLLVGTALSGRAYWVANGLLLTLGLALGFLVVPWHRWSYRVGTAVLLIGVGVLIGALSPTI